MKDGDSTIKETKFTMGFKSGLNIDRPIIVIIFTQAIRSKKIARTILGTKIIWRRIVKFRFWRRHNVIIIGHDRREEREMEVPRLYHVEK